MLYLDEEHLRILTSLGLTVREAKIYFALNKIGKASIKDLSVAAKMDRPNVYGVITKLQKLNLIEQMLTTPIVYKAVSFDQGVQMMLEHKRNEFSELSESTKELIRYYKRVDKKLPCEESKLIIVPKKKPTEKKFDELFSRTEKSNEAICYWPDPEISLNYLHRWKNMLKKNVAIRLIVHMPTKKELPPQVIELMHNQLFKLRFIADLPKIALSIYDQKEVFLSTSMSTSESSHLLVRSVGFVSFFHDYFELLWEKSTEKNQSL